MAGTDLERLIVSLEASTTKYERAMAKANAATNKSMRQIEDRTRRMGANVDSAFANIGTGFSKSAAVLSRALGLLGVAMGGAALINITGQWTDLNSRITNAVGSMEKGSVVMDRLVSIANRTYSSLDQTAEGYLQNQQALSALGYSTAQQLDLTESLNNALVISATRGDKARSVMDAWSKAMAGGKLSGDNLNTIIQSGGRLSKALADSMGVSVNELRRLGSEGKITTNEMFGVTSQLADLRAEAEAMPATVQDAVTKLNTALIRFIGGADEAAGGSSALAGAIERLAAAIDDLPRAQIFDWLASEAEAFNRGLEATEREIEGIGAALEYLKATRTDEFFQDMWAAMTGQQSQRAQEAVWGLEDALRDVAVAASQAIPGEAGDKMAVLAGEFLYGKKTAEEAKAALLDLGKESPDLAPTIGRLWTLIDTLSKVYSGAMDAAAALQSVPLGMGGPVNSRGAAGAAARRLAARKSLESDGSENPGTVTVTPTKPSGGGSRQSPGERWSEEVEQWERRRQSLEEETALMRALGCAFGDYGSVMDTLAAAA